MWCRNLLGRKMNLSFLAGAFVSWLVFTNEGKAFGNKAAKYIKENLLVENKNEQGRKKD